jgi:hypothetical protein
MQTREGAGADPTSVACLFSTTPLPRREHGEERDVKGNLAPEVGLQLIQVRHALARVRLRAGAYTRSLQSST